MPKPEAEGVGTFDVEEPRRLLLPIEEDAGVDIVHSCEGYARCSTCRVEVLEGEPEMMAQSELVVLVMEDLTQKVRLSCQAATLRCGC